MGESVTLIKKSAKTLIFDISCVSSVSKAYFVVKNSLSDADTGALVKLTITGTMSSDGQITSAGPPKATLNFSVTPTKLDSIVPGHYVWSIKCISGGLAYSPPLGRGILNVLEHGVDATS